MTSPVKSKHGGGLFAWKVIGIVNFGHCHRKQLAALQDWLVARLGSIDVIYCSDSINHKSGRNITTSDYDSFTAQTTKIYGMDLTGYNSPIEFAEKWIDTNIANKTPLFGKKPQFIFENVKLVEIPSTRQRQFGEDGLMNPKAPLNYQGKNNFQRYRQYLGLLDMLIVIPPHNLPNAGSPEVIALKHSFTKLIRDAHTLNVPIIQFVGKEGYTTGYPD